jgi:N-acetylmuramoyl-L-alanine amidase
VTVEPQQIRVSLAAEAEVDSYVLDNPFRLVFDVHRTSSVVTAPAAPLMERPTGWLGIRTIVIDPGHGGKETGAIGPSGAQEKDLTLELARELKGRLEQKLPVRVVLTRDGDVEVAHDTRTAIANQNQANLFISLHLNSSLGAGAHGAETYFLSTEASDARAALAAAAENLGTNGPSAQDDTAAQDLQLILWDLAQTHHLVESQRLANMIQGELNETLQLKDRGVKQAPFRVLMGATMPAVLVEVGFLSNPDEEKKLQDPAYRFELVDALTRAVGRFKAVAENREQPPGDAPPGPAPAAPGAPGAPGGVGSPGRQPPAAGTPP